MSIPYVIAKVEKYRLARARARRKRIAILSLCGFGFLAIFAGSVIAGIALAKGREERAALRGERRRAIKERVQSALDLSDDDTPAAAYYDSEKGEFKKADKAKA